MPEKAGLEIHADLKALRKELKTALGEFRQFNQDAVKAAAGVGKVEAAANKAGKQLGFFNSTLGKTIVAMTGGFLGAGAVTRLLGFFKNWGTAIIGASSALTELDSKARIVFGETFPQVEARVQSISAEVGRSSSAILQFSADMAAVIDAAGLTKQATAGMSTEFAKLAVDLASFHNTSDVEAFNALRSAITGELEPMKRFGVVMTQANLQAYALSKGIKQKIETMTQAQLTALRYNYILDRTTTAQGDAARTAGSYANQSRRLQGEIQELNEELGKSATPALASGLSVLNSVIQNVRIFVSLLIQDIKSLFAMLNISVGGSTIGSSIKSSITSAVNSVPVIGPALTAGGKLLGNRVSSRLAEQKALEAVNQGSLPLPSLDEMMKQYAGPTGKGGGGADSAKKAAEDLARAEQDVLQALNEEARANLENLRLRREDLLTRQKLGVLTRQEERDLERINNRLEFKGELLDDLVRKWEGVKDKIKDSSENLADLRKQLKELESGSSKDRVDKLVELMRERNELTGQRGGATDLSGDDSRRLGEIESILSSAKPSEVADAEKRAGLNPVQESMEEEKQKRKEILDQIEFERNRMDQLKDEAKRAEQEIVDALKERASQTQATYKLIEEATRNHVQMMISELSKLQRKQAEVGMGSVSIPDPGSGGGTVTNNSSQVINVNQQNYGDAASSASDARGIRWTLRKNS